MDKILRVQTIYKTGRITVKIMSKGEYAIYREDCMRNDNIDEVRILRDK